MVARVLSSMFVWQMQQICEGVPRPFSPWHNREGASGGAGILWGPSFVVVIDVVVGMMFLL